LRNYTDKQMLFIKTHKEKGNTWDQTTQLFNSYFKEKVSAEALRKAFARYGYEISDEATTIIDNIKAKHRASKAKAQAQKENKYLIEEIIGFEDFKAEIKDFNKQVPIKLHKPLKATKNKKKTKRTVVAHVSDTHIGVVINREEMGNLNEFNPTVASRRFAAYFQQVAEYKKHHREDTDLVLLFNGDITAGVIHNQEWGVLPMSSQHGLALRILSQGISYLAQHYSKIRVVCTAGNHGRFMHKENKGRQMSQKWDGFDTVLYESLQEVFRSNENIEFHIPRTPYALIDIQGHKALATHGDTFLNVGNVSRSINVDDLKNQINNMIIGLGQIDMVLVGHVHKNTIQTLDNGTELLINNTLSGLDGFAQGLGIVSNNPSQQIFEVTSEHVVGDIRTVKLKKADTDKSLDKIIQPIVIKLD
jgi:predicted phosphodiesterase